MQYANNENGNNSLFWLGLLSCGPVAPSVPSGCPLVRGDAGGSDF